MTLNSPTATSLDWENDWDGDATLLAGIEGAGALAATRPPARRVAVCADRTGRGRRGAGR